MNVAGFPGFVDAHALAVEGCQLLAITRQQASVASDLAFILNSFAGILGRLREGESADEHEEAQAEKKKCFHFGSDLCEKFLFCP